MHNCRIVVKNLNFQQILYREFFGYYYSDNIFWYILMQNKFNYVRMQ